MKHLKHILISLMLLSLFGQLFSQSTYDTSKPWTYWWWMGSAATKADVKQHLTDFSEAGLGGVHIIPIYGAKGYEEQFLPFLGEEWMEIVQFTIETAEEMNLGVDLTLGTGWPFGGSWMQGENAAQYLWTKEYQAKQNDLLEIRLDSVLENHGLLQIISVFATNEQGDMMDLSDQISQATIRQEVKPGNWKLSCLGIKNTGQKVKRAAPGGEGPVMDYFDQAATAHYLQHFDSIFAQTAFPIHPRAVYHDSYETYRANWTGQFLTRFEELRGYDVQPYLHILSQASHPDRPFLLHDLRETLSDLLYSEFATTWTEWSSEKETITRYQAHGSPGNLLDLYALADVPETESFGCSEFSIPGLQCDPDYREEQFGRPSPLMMKFASSPAHLFRKPLVSSETGTWLGNHFKVALSQVKPQIDELFVSGINHVFYHGTSYSPVKEAYPGWLFYASTNFGPTSHFWDEMPLLNGYITTCQQALQTAAPDNDILLYFPIHDLWTQYPGDVLLLLDVHKYSNWFSQTKFGETAQVLWDQGYTFDYVSDQQLGQMQANAAGKLSIDGQTSYSTIVVPSVEYIDQETLESLEALAQQGARILFVDQLPQHLSGFAAHQQPTPALATLSASLAAKEQVVVSNDLLKDLQNFPLRQESIKQQGLDFIRKRDDEGYVYFVTNLSDQFYADSISLNATYQFVELTDPQRGKQGFVATTDQFFLQLPPGKSCLIRTRNAPPESAPWSYLSLTNTQILDGSWQAQVVLESGENARRYDLDSLHSWTEWGDEALNSFCGKMTYTTKFSLKDYDKERQSYLLVLEDIRETAEVSVNGVSCGTIWSLPYQLEIPAKLLKRKNNLLEITVQNLSANRIKAIDTRGENWKKFYDINIVDIQYQRFDASKWSLTPSGLLGQVKLVY